MTYELTENQSYDLNFLKQYKVLTSGNKVTFYQDLSPEDIIAVEAHFNEMTQVDRDAFNKEEKRKADITSKADAYILSAYCETKQRKLISLATALIDKSAVQGINLDVNEQALLQQTRDIDAWISSVRDAENAAQADGITIADDVIFPAKLA